MTIFFIEGNRVLGFGDFRLAIEYYTNALEIDPGFDQALNNCGVTLIESNHPHEAIIGYNLALQINPAFRSILIMMSVGSIDPMLMNKSDNSKGLERCRSGCDSHHP